MKINKLNYENFVIDYIEGTLSVEKKKDFDLFLEKNKEVYDEIKDYMSAPILEEPEVVFENKKAITKKSSTIKYALLALLPIILIGAYFLMGNENNVTSKKSPIVEKIEKRNQQEVISEKKTITPVKIIEEPTEEKVEIKEVEETKEVKSKFTPTIQKENLEVKKKTEPIVQQFNFASTEIKREKRKVEPIQRRETLSQPNQIAIAQVSFDHTTSQASMSNMMFAELKSFDESNLESEINQEKKNSNWLEMITPAAFEDIDLKESLAIQSNIDKSKTRKILNAFIPESLVK